MNILVIGFGNMGCRHAQAFLQDNSYKVSVIEPNGTVFNSNLPRIGGTNENISRTTFAECQKNFFDFAVIATSAEMRLTLFKEVLNIGIKNILLEKVVFQSAACNALHYIDLFKYFTGTDITLIKSNLVKSESPNVRGDKYVEVFGQQIWESENGDRLFISSDSENNSGKGSENQIRYRKNVHIINENTLNQFNIGSNGKLEVRKFDMPMASKLTETLYQNIKAGTIKLPDIKETMNYHLQFFESINNSLGLLKSDSCPIT